MQTKIIVCIGLFFLLLLTGCGKKEPAQEGPNITHTTVPKVLSSTECYQIIQKPPYYFLNNNPLEHKIYCDQEICCTLETGIEKCQLANCIDKKELTK